MSITIAETPQTATTTVLAFLVSCASSFKDVLGVEEAYGLCAYSLDAPEYLPSGSVRATEGSNLIKAYVVRS